MIGNRRPAVEVEGPPRAWKGRVGAALGVLGLSATAWAGVGPGDWPPGTHYYSTAEAPVEYRGPLPGVLLAMNDSTAALRRERDLIDRAVAPARAPEGEAGTAAIPPPADPPAPAPAAVPRVASSAGRALLQGAGTPHL